ncbi:MAG: TlpA family protein disulfide reductase [Alistipes sp.]|nr:TlpA family protein disulfide reductase [Alistipes sp.]
MAFETKYKKRGSNLSLIIMLIALLGLVAAILLWPNEAQATEGELAANVEQQDDVEATTLVKVGEMAPDFSVEMLDGRTIKLSELRGKVVMVCFWATWCPPCRQEMAHLQEGVIDHFAGKDLVVLPISRGEKRDVVEKFINYNGYTFGVGLDPERAIYDMYASNYVPRTFIVDKSGKVTYCVAGYDEETAEAVNAAIAKALR